MFPQVNSGNEHCSQKGSEDQNHNGPAAGCFSKIKACERKRDEKCGPVDMPGGVRVISVDVARRENEPFTTVEIKRRRRVEEKNFTKNLNCETGPK